MSAVRKSISCFLIIQLILMGFTKAWDDTRRYRRSDISGEEPLSTWVLERLEERVAALRTAENQQRVADLRSAENEQPSSAINRRTWVPDAGYTSRGQAGADVSSKLLAQAFAQNPYGPGKRR